MRLFTIPEGEELIASIRLQAAEHGVVNGAIVSLVGGVDSCEISMPAKDGTDIPSEFTQQFELTGTGEIIDGKIHVHAALGREGDWPLVGHLLRARVKPVARIYVIALPPAEDAGH